MSACKTGMVLPGREEVLGKPVLSSSAPVDKECGDGDLILEKMSGQRPGSLRAHPGWVQILELHFLSCVASGAIFHLSEPPV